MEINILWKQDQTNLQSGLEERSANAGHFLCDALRDAPEQSYGTV